MVMGLSGLFNYFCFFCSCIVYIRKLVRILGFIFRYRRDNFRKKLIGSYERRIYLKFLFELVIFIVIFLI